jgi:Putative auto-transporter adhesin, head GIN domain
MKKYSFLLLAIVPMLLFFSSCRMRGVKGNGVMATREIQVGSFHSVQAGSSFDVHLVQGTGNEVKVTAEENIHAYLNIRVENGVLVIGTRPDTYIRTHRDVDIYVTSPEYRSIRVSGSGNVTGESVLKSGSEIEFSVSGSGDIRAEVDAPRISGKVTGSGNMDLNGLTRDCELRCSGSGNLECDGLKAENVKAEVTGSGNASVFASATLDARISGSGNLNYSGNPQVTSKVSGSGELSKR